MTRLVPLLCAALSGCGGPIPILLSTTRQGGDFSNPEEETRQILDDAFGFWGLEYEIVEERAYGRLVIGLVDLEEHSPTVGMRTDGGFCREQIWVDYHWSLLAHELGHAFGIDDHHPEERNIMFAEQCGKICSHEPTVTDDQLDTVQAGAFAFTGCVP